MAPTTTTVSPPAAFAAFTVASRHLGREMAVRVWTPPGVENPPVLYLLHGRNGTPESWSERPRLAALLAGLPLAVACLRGENSFYTDYYGGGDWEKAVVCEQITAIEAHFRVGGKRSRRMLAGYSMGGFGAVKTALKYPERFCAAYSLSGSFGSARSTDEAHKFLVFGPEGSAHRRANDPFALAPQVPAARRPALAFDCGKDDLLLYANWEFHHLLTRLGWDHRFREHDGSHDWAYWDARLPDLLLWARKQMKF